MTIRPKTIRRLLILATSAVIITGTIGLAFTARRFARENQIAEARSLGLGAFKAGDYPRSLESLGKYVLSRPNDVEVLYALGCARLELESPNREYVFEARDRFQQLLVIDPNHTPAAIKLLAVYEKTKQSAQMLELADKVLLRSPNDPAVMRYRAIALTRLNRPADARIAWEKVVALTPKDVTAQSQLLTAMRLDGVSDEEVIRRAQSLVDNNSNNAEFKIPLATALRDAGRDAESLAVLKSLTAHPPADPEAVLELVTMLDRARAFDDAQCVLERAAQTLDSSMLSSALVQRLWQGGRAEQVITLTDKLVSETKGQPTVLALRALSLASLNRRDEAAKLVSRLEDGESAIERAWSEALRVEFSALPTTPAQRVEAFSKALTRDPNNGIIYTWLARSLMEIGEIDQAARCYRESAQRMPSWSTPCIELAQAMLSAGRTEEAIPAAKAAFLRSPTSAAAQVQVARVRYAALQDRFDASEQAALLKFVSELRSHLPDEPSLLPIHITLLARTDKKTDAQSLIQETLNAKPSAQLLHLLFQVDFQYSLGQSATILDTAKLTGHLSPELLTAQAGQLIAQGHPDQAKAIADSLSKAAASSPSAAIAEARVRTLLGDATAANVWRDATLRFPQDLGLQVASLDEAKSLVADRDFQTKVIANIRAISGSDGVYWRIEQARFLASSDKTEDVRQALALASELVREQPSRTDLRVLLGRVLTRLDSGSTALEHLRAAYEQAPASPAVGLELVDAFLQLGRTTDAQATLKRLSHLDIEDAAVRNRLASALSENGMSDDLLQMLERARSCRFLDQAGLVLLAETLSSSDRTADASKLYEELIRENPSPAVFASAAAFRRETGDLDAAQRLVDQIPNASGTTAARSYAAARYHARFGEVEPARKAFAIAMSDVSCDASITRDAIALELSSRNYSQAQRLLDEAKRRFPNHPLLNRAEIELSTMQAGDSNASIESLVELLSKDPGAKLEVETIKAALATRQAGQVTPELANKLVSLANRYPAAFELQRQTITACIAVNQAGPAVMIAHRVAEMSAARADMLELAARTFAHFGQWNSARKSALAWRALASDSPREPDLLLALIAQSSGDSKRSLSLSDGFVAGFEPQRDLPNIAARASALVAAGRADECFAMLARWTDSNKEVRSLWLGTARNLNVEQTAQRLDQLTRVTPTDSGSERVALAAAYLELSERNGDPQAAKAGLLLVGQFADAADAAEMTRILRAELYRASGETAKAEAELRGVLKVWPDSGRAKNSLAYLLLAESQNADEALHLAAEAAIAMPDRPSVLDTHARAMMKQGDLAGASRRFKDALRLDPTYLDALVGLALVCHQQGNVIDAQAMLEQIDHLLAEDMKLYVPAHLRVELATLRQSISTTRE